MINEADILAGLQFVANKGDFETAPLTAAEQLVVKWVEAAINAAKKQLNDHGRVASGRLAQSIAAEPIVKLSMGGFRVVITAEDYADFIDQGVDGIEQKHGSPFSFKKKYVGRKMADAIRSWVPEKGYMLPTGFASYDRWSYAIATNVKKKGIKPSNFISDNINENSIDKLRLLLEDHVGRSLTVSIENRFKKK